MRWEDWRSRLWPLPALGVAVAVGLGVLLPRVDVAVAAHLPPALAGHLFSGGPEAARTVLSAIAGSLITVSALTFSLTVVTLQLAASQFSPRLLRTFTRDPAVQVTLALLIGTFTYAVMVLRTVRSDTQTQAAFVPQLSVTLAFVLGLIAFVTLIAFLAHLVRQIRIELLLQRVTAETTATMHRLREDRRHDQGQPPAAAPGAAPVPARRTGFLVAVDDTALLKAAVDAGAVISLDRRVGDWLIEGTPIAHTWPATPAPEADPAADEDLAAALDQALTIGPERTAAQDIAFGLRQLTEVAVKALSPGINDPTTAVHALHHTSALLCGLARQPPSPRVLHDEQKRPRAVIGEPELPELLDLAIGQPRRYGAAEPDIQARLLTMLREVAWCTTEPHTHDAIRIELDQINDTISAQQHYTATERARLRSLSADVRAALAGRWPPES
ncbi:DUF2254 domain-containing protein [Catellatospora coxensis]|uniref:Uncharacterized protein n=1 Tax=Catellatospora coxensis TaxID=310354 RepID=A0A8J3KN98_9ACTN|nr:DUF2254 domain-containing protein [Catellatospora coxensis]GIG05663.1 hypothetical protein Cco03nite_23630 [Catellatospora coxensis]